MLFKERHSCGLSWRSIKDKEEVRQKENEKKQRSSEDECYLETVKKAAWVPQKEWS